MQLHPGALYLLGAVYLTGDCVKRDIASAMWCFHRASEKVANGRDQLKIVLFYLQP
jgi:TPR repeat protein